MAEHGSQERILGGSTVEQDDERRIAEITSEIAARTRDYYGISEEIIEGEISQPKSLNFSKIQGEGGSSRIETIASEVSHGAHIFQLRQQIMIAIDVAPEEIEVLKRAA